MGIANWWIGEVTHEDDRDGSYYSVVFPNDISPELQETVLRIAGEEGTEVTFAVSRENWEQLLKNISISNDISDLGDGSLADLVEPYLIGTAR